MHTRGALSQMFNCIMLDFQMSIIKGRGYRKMTNGTCLTVQLASTVQIFVKDVLLSLPMTS